MTTTQGGTLPGSRLTQLSRSVVGYRAIVTGGGSGIGEATARLFADEGMRVVIADVDAEAASRVAAAITATYGPDSAVPIAADLADRHQIDALAAATLDQLGGLDVLVNNAGVSLFNHFEQDDEEFEQAWSRTHEVNITALARLTRRMMPALLGATAGRVVNIASTEAKVAAPGLISYSATKAAIIGLTQSLAVQYGPRGVTVNCICPGPIDTQMTSVIPQAKKQTYARRRVPLRRYGTPEELAHMVLNLVLPSSSFVTGATVLVDGGMTIRHT